MTPRGEFHLVSPCGRWGSLSLSLSLSPSPHKKRAFLPVFSLSLSLSLLVAPFPPPSTPASSSIPSSLFFLLPAREAQDMQQIGGEDGRRKQGKNKNRYVFNERRGGWTRRRLDIYLTPDGAAGEPAGIGFTLSRSFYNYKSILLLQRLRGLEDFYD